MKRAPSNRTYTYHMVALESARIIHRSTGEFITNPRNIGDRSLLSQDSVWVSDLARYMNEFDYQKWKIAPDED